MTLILSSVVAQAHSSQCNKSLTEASKNPEELQALIDAPIDAAARINAVDEAGNTPLHRAARYSSPEEVQVLIGAGANIHAVDKAGRTPLHIAARYSSPEKVQVPDRCWGQHPRCG